MRIIICGANQIGSNIAEYLSKENNDITVVDTDSELLSQISNDFDVNTIVGTPSDPNALEMAEAGECDIIIAVMESDETNMVICQVGHSLFGIPKKIARIRNQSYLDPVWSNLFSRSHMPIDVIISPERLIANDVYQRIMIPGATTAIKLGGGKACLIGVVCMEDCPVLNTPLVQLRKLFPDLSFSIVSLMRKSKSIIPDETEVFEENDEVFMVVESNHIHRVMAAFGHMEKDAEKIVIYGGGNIAATLVKKLQKNFNGLQIKLIENNRILAESLSEKLTDVIILSGDALKHSIMEEASVSNADIYIALTDNDESNILGSLLAKQYGCKMVSTLVKNSAYFPFLNMLGVDMMVSPESVVVSNIMQHVRKGRIISIHSINGGETEVSEVKITESASVANRVISDLVLPMNVVIAAIVREGKIIIPEQDDKILPHDHLIVLSPQEKAREMEEILSTHVDFV